MSPFVIYVATQAVEHTGIGIPAGKGQPDYKTVQISTYIVTNFFDKGIFFIKNDESFWNICFSGSQVYAVSADEFRFQNAERGCPTQKRSVLIAMRDTRITSRMICKIMRK